MPHFFYKIMEKTLVGRTKLNQFVFFACERLVYTPLFQALSLFSLSIFEVSWIFPMKIWIRFFFLNVLFVFQFLQGKSQDVALQNLYALYWPVLKANWTYLSLLVFINIRFVPPIVTHLLFFDDIWYMFSDLNQYF